MTTEDIPAVLKVALRSPGAARWSRRDYEQACAQDRGGWVAETRNTVIAFLVARKMADELEILNLGVAPEHRRQGIAARLLRKALNAGQSAGARRAFLEVRASNAAAITFYERLGFRSAGRRPRYYAHPREDALVLCRDLAGCTD